MNREPVNFEPATPKPPWLRRKFRHGAAMQKVRGLLRRDDLRTVCEEALCPNLGECFSEETATFLILGDRCTRDCRFCAVRHGCPAPPDPEEPVRVAEAAGAMGLRYVVVTSVTRDDLSDGGASWFVKTIEETRSRIPQAVIEVLVPDFRGSPDALRAVAEAGPDVLNHNLETVPRLYPTARSQAKYERSLRLLAQSREWTQTRNRSVLTKSGLILGLGETYTELKKTLDDLLCAGCRLLTLGQYLQPTKQHLPVARFVPPEEFDEWRDIALDMGFAAVAAGPYVRSSYQAKALYEGGCAVKRVQSSEPEVQSHLEP